MANRREILRGLLGAASAAASSAAPPVAVAAGAAATQAVATAAAVTGAAPAAVANVGAATILSAFKLDPDKLLQAMTFSWHSHDNTKFELLSKVVLDKNSNHWSMLWALDVLGEDDPTLFFDNDRVCDYFSKEARAGWYIRACGEPVSSELLEGWLQHDQHNGTYDDFRPVLDLLNHYGIPFDSTMPIRELYARVQSDARQEVGNVLTHWMKHEPEKLHGLIADLHKYNNRAEELALADKLMKEKLAAGAFGKGKKRQGMADKIQQLFKSPMSQQLVYTVEELCARKADDPLVHFMVQKKEYISGAETLTSQHLGLSNEDMRWEGAKLSVPANSIAAKRLTHVARTTGQFTLADLKKPLPQVHEPQHEQTLETSAGILSFGA